MNRDDCNAFRYDGGPGGHYESYFQRANHPTRPLAFWIRYTVFVPRGRPGDAVGERWAIWFDGEARRQTALRDRVPLARCRFDPTRLDARIDDATLDGGHLAGRASALGHTVAWELAYSSPAAPLLLLPEALYAARLPRAKALVGSPLARYRGTVTVDGVVHPIDDWPGSQNHNWGSRHTDQYAWGQVAGFDDAPECFLEVSTARVRLGPLWSPWLTVLVLRDGAREYRLNDLLTAARARARYEGFTWTFASRAGDLTVEGRMEAAPDAFVALPYDNPPGGRKTCLNSKLARCELTLTPSTGPARRLVSRHRAAFEILTDRSDHGVPVLEV